MTAKPKGKILEIAAQSNKTEQLALAKAAIRPTLQAAATVEQYGKWFSDDLDLMGLVTALGEQTNSRDSPRSESWRGDVDGPSPYARCDIQ